MIIDQAFIILCLLALFVGNDGRVVGVSLGAALVFSYESNLHAAYCLFFSFCLFFVMQGRIKSTQTRSIFIMLILLDICAFFDYFVPYETLFYLSYPIAVFIIKLLLMLSIFSELMRNGQNTSAYDIDSMFNFSIWPARFNSIASHAMRPKEDKK